VVSRAHDRRGITFMTKRTTIPAAAAVPPPVVLHPQAVYSFAQARQALGLTKSTLAREVRLKRLRVSKRAGKYFILGIWLLQWIKDGELRRNKQSEPTN
jgi:hypothetical protein